MYKIYIIALFIFCTVPLQASPSKEKLADALFEEAGIKETLEKAAEQNFPGLSNELQFAFNENQNKFNDIFKRLRTRHLEKWVDKITENYRNMWIISYTENFSETELEEMLKVYKSAVFKKFQEQFDRIDLAHIEQLSNNTVEIMLAYNQLLKESLEEAKKNKLNQTLIEDELKKLDLIQGDIRKNEDKSLKKSRNF